MDLVAASVQRHEFVAVVDSADEIRGSSVTKHEIVPLFEFPGAGQLFEEGRYLQGFVLDEKFEDIGGFSILKSQASLYKQIWLKYGHIASSQVLSDLYPTQVTVVMEIMSSIMNMHHCCLAEVSPEMIDLWEKKIKVAEKLEFNIRWLRERFEVFKKHFYGDQKLKAALLERNQAKDQLVAANIELKKAQENLSDLENRISHLLSERRKYIEKGQGLVLFEDDMSISLVLSRKQKDVLPIEEPVNNNPSKAVVPAESVAEGTNPLSLSTLRSSAEGPKRKPAGDDGKVGGNGEPSEKKVKTIGNESKSSAEDGSRTTTKLVRSNSSVPSRDLAPSSTETALTASIGPTFLENEIRVFLLQNAEVTTKVLGTRFSGIVKTKEDKVAFLEIMKRISVIPKTKNGLSYVALRKK